MNLCITSEYARNLLYDTYLKSLTLFPYFFQKNFFICIASCGYTNDSKFYPLLKYVLTTSLHERLFWK